jgi:hypothetical protein
MLAFEWSVYLYASIILVSILLPDIFGIGRSLFYTHQAASYGIQLAMENGRMTEDIATRMENYLRDRRINEFEIHGSREDTVRQFGQDVEVHVSTIVRPRILRIMPDMRLSSTFAVEGGVVRLTAHKVDVSSVYVRN